MQPGDLGRYLLRLTGPPYWRERIATLLRHGTTGRVAQPFVTARLSPAVVREARHLLLSYAGIAAASVALQSWAALIYWVVPALPFDALPAAHGRLAKPIDVRARGYWAAHRDILMQIRNHAV